MKFGFRSLVRTHLRPSAVGVVVSASNLPIARTAGYVVRTSPICREGGGGRHSGGMAPILRKPFQWLLTAGLDRTNALLITLMLLAASGSAVAQTRDNAHPPCTDHLLHRKAIEHGYQHQPTTAEIACKQEARGRSSLGADTDRAIVELYEDAMRRSALVEPRATLEETSGRGDQRRTAGIGIGAYQSN
jgi:hypothetical protein